MKKSFFFLKYLSGTMFCVCFCVCTCTNQLVLSSEVTRLNTLNSIVMGQINQCGFQSHVAIDRYCIFLEITSLCWVALSWYNVLCTSVHFLNIDMTEVIVIVARRKTKAPLCTLLYSRQCLKTVAKVWNKILSERESLFKQYTSKMARVRMISEGLLLSAIGHLCT